MAAVCAALPSLHCMPSPIVPMRKERCIAIAIALPHGRGSKAARQNSSRVVSVHARAIAPAAAKAARAELAAVAVAAAHEPW